MRDIKVIFRREITRSITPETIFYGSDDSLNRIGGVLMPDIRPHDRRPRKVKLMKSKLLYQSY